MRPQQVGDGHAALRLPEYGDDLRLTERRLPHRLLRSAAVYQKSVYELGTLREDEALPWRRNRRRTAGVTAASTSATSAESSVGSG